MEREGGYKGASLVLQTKHPKNTENCDFGSRLQTMIGHYPTPTKRRGHHYCTMIAPQTRIRQVKRPSSRDNEFHRVIKCLLQSCHRELTNVSPWQCLRLLAKDTANRNFIHVYKLIRHLECCHCPAGSTRPLFRSSPPRGRQSIFFNIFWARSRKKLRQLVQF